MIIFIYTDPKNTNNEDVWQEPPYEARANRQSVAERRHAHTHKEACVQCIYNITHRQCVCAHTILYIVYIHTQYVCACRHVMYTQCMQYAHTYIHTHTQYMEYVQQIVHTHTCILYILYIFYVYYTYIHIIYIMYVICVFYINMYCILCIVCTIYNIYNLYFKFTLPPSLCM